MLLSMTGFGKGSSCSATKKISVEIKSLNSKQLDLTVRLPYYFREHEMELRQSVGRRAERGKIDLSAGMENLAGAECTPSARLDIGIMQAYSRQVAEAAEALGTEMPADLVALLMRFPDTIRTDSTDTAGDDDSAALAEAASKALEAMMDHRRQEGRELEKFFAARIEVIRGLLDSIAPYEAERVPRIRARLEENIARIPALEFDKGRMEQELIFYIEKLDVNEEKQRLRKHLDYFLETMNAPAAGQGKKLGFIAQEMGREINTLGSKSNHAEMQAIVVRMKDALEQIKEQVLNVM